MKGVLYLLLLILSINSVMSQTDKGDMCSFLQNREKELLKERNNLIENYNLSLKKISVWVNEATKCDNCKLYFYKNNITGSDIKIVYHTKRKLTLDETLNNKNKENNWITPEIEKIESEIRAWFYNTYRLSSSQMELNIADTCDIKLTNYGEFVLYDLFYTGEEINYPIYVKDDGLKIIFLAKKDEIISQKPIFFSLLVGDLIVNVRPITKKMDTFIRTEIIKENPNSNIKRQPFIEITYTITIENFYKKELYDINSKQKDIQNIRNLLSLECK